MKRILFIAILFLPTLSKSQPQFIDVGEKIVRVDFYQDRYGLTNLDVVVRLIAAINSATHAGLLKWEKVVKDSIQSKPKLGFYVIKPIEAIENTIVLGRNTINYQPQKGEIVATDGANVWKTKNLDLVIFFQLYFFGIKPETK